jgi:hypothetical protein
MNEVALRHDVGFSVGWRRQGTVAILVAFTGPFFISSLLAGVIIRTGLICSSCQEIRFFREINN